MSRHDLIKLMPPLMLLIIAVSLIAQIATVVHAQESVLRIPLMSKPSTLSPFKINSVWDGIVIGTPLESLVANDPENPSRMIPWLAENFTVSEDGKVWIFKLRKNVYWHDGKPFTADDVVFTFKLAMSKKTPGYWYTNVPLVVDSVEKVDNYTVKIVLKKTFAPFLIKVASVPILPKHVWEPVASKPDFDPSTYEPTIDMLVGTGPFIIQSYDPAVGASYRVNENYWGPKPKVSKLVYPIITNPDAMFFSLLKGEIDTVTWSIPPKSVLDAIRDPNIAVVFVIEPSFYFLGFNTQKYPMNLEEFRKAIGMVIDRQYIVDTVLGGFGVPGNPGILSPVFTDLVNPKAYELLKYDVEGAKKLLDELGFVDRDGDGIRETPNGTKLTFELLTPSYDPVRVQAGNLISQWAAKVGIKITNNPVDFNELVNRAMNGAFDMFILGWIAEPDPDWLHDLLHGSQSAPTGFNLARINDSELNALLDEQRVTVDYEKRKEVVWRIQEVVAKKLPYVSLYHRVAIYGARIDTFSGWVQTIGYGYNPMSTAFGYANGWSLLNVIPSKDVPKPVIDVSEVRKEVAIGEPYKVRVKVSVDGKPSNEAWVVANIVGVSNPGYRGQVVLRNIGDGVYEGTFDTSTFSEGNYLLQVVVKDKGMSKAVLELTAKKVAPPPSPTQTPPTPTQSTPAPTITTVTTTVKETVTVTSTVTVTQPAETSAMAMVGVVVVLVIIVLTALVIMRRK